MWMHGHYIIRMQIEISSLPENPDELKSIIVSLQKEIAAIKKNSEFEIAHWKDKFLLVSRRFWGPKSEKYGKDEWYVGRLFNEAETHAKSAKPKETKITVAEHTRKKGGRKPLPSTLPREQIVHDISEEEKKLPDGRELVKIGEDKTEKLRMTPPQFTIEEHIYPKYVHPGDESDGSRIVMAQPAPQIIPKSMATPSLLANIIAAKFCDSLPFYRQEQIFQRYRIDLKRQTMSQWAMKLHENMVVLKDLMEADLLSGDILGMDETWVQVLNEKDRNNTTKSYMWVARGGPLGKPILLYHYSPTRSGGFVKDYLKDWKGYLQCDGYPGYNSGTKDTPIKLAGCWAHVRRKFLEANDLAKHQGHAAEAMKHIQELYKIEKDSRMPGMGLKDLEKNRKELSKPLLESFKTNLDRWSAEVPPGTPLGKAVHYALGEWPKLEVYLEDGRIPIDNNMVENAIRPFVVGRKNWLFSNCPDGADASAFLYSLIETAKANCHEPFWYLYYLFEEFPKCKGEDDYRKLLPYNVMPDDTVKPFLKKKSS